VKEFAQKHNPNIEHMLKPNFTRENFIYEQKAVLVDITLLREHESVDLSYLGKLKEEITKDGFLRKAISVDVNSMVVLDGHHRLNALRELGCDKIPVILVDYKSPDIVVKKWKVEDDVALEDIIVTKEYIINTALSGKRLPVKTSKHLILLNGKLLHISAIETDVDEPLNNLRRSR
jgi:hypothetical protein